uniref:polyvinylalcohol dehydrogenase-like n=1 Tax=Erigeron canadensis TaxID=72917 RepID=UPI001CB8E5C7|nr:polyvinylalcohol dehydrogenase-like [Erigeron canadensis]
MASTCLYLSIFLWLLFIVITSANPTSWTNHGGDLSNRRYANGETKINPATVANLTLKWKFVAGNDITATPAIYNNTLYFPSWNGNIYALNASDGSVIWQKNVGQLTGLNATGFVPGVNWSVARATPTIADDLLIIGIYGPCYVIGLKRSNGQLVWSTQLDTHYACVITMSGTYHKSAFYVGTSSSEEAVATIQTCCTFRGSFFKLNAKNGNIMWQTYMLPDNNGSTNKYSGAGLWGSSPSIDIQRNEVYIGTGNLYSAPLNVTQCQEAQNNQTTPTEEDKCIEPENHSNSILALDLDSGNIIWYKQLGGYDVWFFACNNLSTSGCPPGPNPDADFAQAPMMLTINVRGSKRDIVVAVQKSGIAWALDRDNGSIIWSTEAGPGGAGGGGTWGSATDEKTIYTNIANSAQSNFTLKPSNITTTSGGWVSMNATSGKVLWSTGNPSNATASGPVSLANGVVFAGSTNGSGPIYAMSATTGEILWSYNTGATVYGGMSISKGCVYVGSGYKSNMGAFFPSYTAGTTLFAFCILP